MSSIKIEDIQGFVELAKLGMGLVTTWRNASNRPVTPEDPVTLADIQALRISKLEEEAAVARGRERAGAEG